MSVLQNEAFLFSVPNFCISLMMHRYYGFRSSRILLLSGVFNSALPIIGATMERESPSLANSYSAAGMGSAIVIHTLHQRKMASQGVVCPGGQMGSILLLFWLGSVSVMFVDRVRWAVALQHDR